MRLTIAVVVAFAATVSVLPWLIAALHRKAVLDHPSERSSHDRVTVRGAGVAVAIGATAGLATWSGAGHGRWWVAGCALGFGVVGFVDDVRSLSPKLRLVVQFVGSLAALVVAVAAHEIARGWVLPVLGAFGVMAYVNAFNFMDGINGISGGQALVAGAVLAIEAHRVHAQVGVLAGAVVAAAAVGFLPFNVPRARAFLGDVGSYFIGAWLALTAVIVVDSGGGIVAVVAVAAVYATDTSITLAGRIRRGEDWWTPHRQHTYQRLTDLGLSHSTVAIVVSVHTAVAGSLGIVSVGRGNAASAALLIGVAIVCASYLAMPAVVRRLRQR